MLISQFEQVRNNIRHNLAFDDQVSAEESRRKGKELRKGTPRTSHGEWKAPEGRKSPVELLASQGASRVQELLPSAMSAWQNRPSRSIAEARLSWQTT